VEGSPAYEPHELLARVRSLPAAGPLLARLRDAENVHLVGGAVRDLLLGGDPPDLDIVVEGDVRRIVAMLEGAARSHERFGTATVTLDGFTYDVAGARRETYAHPGALPDVEPASLAEDLKRRDFTVNAVALALGGRRAGALTAVERALADLEAGTLRVLHERSFEDDPTRLFRLARYAARLGFDLERQTRGLAERAVAQNALMTVSGSRVGAELRLLARERDPVAALGALRDLGLDHALHPSFGLDDPDLGRRALGLLPADGRADLLVLATAARAVAPTELAALLDRLAFDAGARETVLAAAARSGAVAASLQAAAGDSEIAAALLDAEPELVALAGALGPASRAADWLARLRHVRLEIDGGDLLAAGVTEGPAIGRGLRAALAAKLDGRAETRAAELAEALRAAR
jgi:tRNA nucleotidyltransferase (CCA-adding enzyme)